MKHSGSELRPNPFERQLLANTRAAFLFLFVLVPFISGFTIYCAHSGRVMASAILSVQLFAFIWILYAFRPPENIRKRMIAIRYVPWGQLAAFGFYLIYTVGFHHKLEVTPWFFLYIFLLFLMVPDRYGGFFAFTVILITAVVFWLTGRQVMQQNWDYLVRFFFSLALFASLSYCGVLVRINYLKANERTTRDLRKSEKSYRDLSDRLMENIRERDEIERKLHQAIKMEAVGKMAAGVAHDLNNILSGIVTYPDLMLLDIKKGDPMRESIEMIRNSGIKAAAIVEDLLTLSRRAVNISRVVDLKKILSDYLLSPEHTTLLSRHSNIRIKTVLEPDIKNITGSPVHLTKTLMNLICNALEAMPQGGKVSVELSSRMMNDKKTLFDTISPGEYTVLEVKDTGIGIDEKDIEKIFEPFYTKKVMGRSGTGLGMAVVLGAVKDHNAFIDINSIQGKGTCVTLYFPATDAEVDTISPQPDTEMQAGGGEKILVIDDIPEQLNIACSILKRMGYRPEPCLSGEAAIEKVRQTGYDLVIIDMVMAPGIDGLETYKQILKIYPGQKAVFATGFSNSEKLESARQLGAGPALIKPYSVEKIGDVIRKELAR